jgi:hypothetical protein
MIMNLLPVSRRAFLQTTAAAGIAATLVRTEGTALAQRFGELPPLAFSGNISIRQDVVPTLLAEFVRVDVRPFVDAAWSSVRAKCSRQILDELRRQRFQGQTLRDPQVHLADRGELLANAGVLQYRVRGNRVRTKITTPDIAFGIGLGRGADPQFDVNFDLFITIDLTASLRGVTATRAEVEVHASRPRGSNFTGWLAQAVSDIVAFFGGPNFRNRVRDGINGRTVSIQSQVNRGLEQVNGRLRRFPQQQDVTLSPPGYANGVMTYRIHRVERYEAPRIR